MQTTFSQIDKNMMVYLVASSYLEKNLSRVARCLYQEVLKSYLSRNDKTNDNDSQNNIRLDYPFLQKKLKLSHESIRRGFKELEASFLANRLKDSPSENDLSVSLNIWPFEFGGNQECLMGHTHE